MHIPENYLSPATCGVMTAAMVPVWGTCIAKVKKEIPKEKVPMIGVGAAFSFLAMMFNVPMVGGTTGHAVGGTLIALLFGPEAACLAVTIALLIQAVLFGDGGILAFGANCFNMAFVLPFAGYAVYSIIKKYVKSKSGEYVGAAVGSYVGINLASLCAAIEFGIQPLIYKDVAGQALYCPYPLSVSIPAMMLGHLTVFGIVEVIFTVGVFSYLMKTSSDVFQSKTRIKMSNPIKILLAALICLTPIGLLATGTAWGEWGTDEIATLVSDGQTLGYTPAGMTNGFELSVIFPDYTMGQMPEWFGYILSAVVGVALVVIIFKAAGALRKNKVNYDA